MKIGEAIQQQTFESEVIKAEINLSYTASKIQNHKNVLLKPFNISIQQFNILRILRGQKGKPLSMKEISNRMIDKMSNASRLVEKLRQKGLVERRECPKDRRAVDVKITEQGLCTLVDASTVLESGVKSFLAGLSAQEAKILNELLDQINCQ